MFSVLLESNRPRSAVGGSLALSAIAHVVVMGAAVVVTSQPGSLEPVPESFISRALYMPPVDRRPAEAGTGERLQYVAFGAPVGNLAGYTDLPVGVSEFGRSVRDPDGGSVLGDADLNSIALAPIPSLDTAYSVLDVDSTVQRYPDSDAPLYPPLLLAQSIEGTVLMRYTVDTLGRADMRTARVLRSSHPYFTEAVLQSLPGMRFRPATLGARPVRQLVEQEFGFRIQPREVAAGAPRDSSAAP